MTLLWGDYDPKTHIWVRIELVRVLSSDDDEDREQAMRRLGIVGEDELLPYLADCLTHYNNHLRSAAAGVLVRMGDDSVLCHFIDALADPAFDVRQKAEWAILAFDDYPPLVRHMQRCLRRRFRDESLVNIDSMEALEELGDARAIPCLIDALDVGSDEVLAAAAKALGRFGIECDEATPIESLREQWRLISGNLSGSALGPIYGDNGPQRQKGEKPSLMNDDNTVSVKLEDLCEIGEAVSTMMHDLDNGKLNYLAIEIRKIHEVVEKWVSDKEVLGGCGHSHRCRVCEMFGPAR